MCINFVRKGSESNIGKFRFVKVMDLQKLATKLTTDKHVICHIIFSSIFSFKNIIILFSYISLQEILDVSQCSFKPSRDRTSPNAKIGASRRYSISQHIKIASVVSQHLPTPRCVGLER